VVMAVLDVYMNGYLVGELTKSSTGSHQFAYAQQWLAIPGSRPISLSMLLRKQACKGFFLRHKIQEALKLRAFWYL